MYDALIFRHTVEHFGEPNLAKHCVSAYLGVKTLCKTAWMNQGLEKGFEILSVRMLAWLAGFLDLVSKAMPAAWLFF